LFATSIIFKKKELSDINSLDYSTLLLFSCKANLPDSSRVALLEELVPLLPVHMDKIGQKGFGSLCYSLSLVPKENLSPELFSYLESEFLKRLKSAKTSREYERNGQINCTLLMLLAGGNQVYGSGETWFMIYSNLLEKKGEIGHVSDIESMLFYYDHTKLGSHLSTLGLENDRFLKLI
jgi:hypothetical protein